MCVHVCAVFVFLRIRKSSNQINQLTGCLFTDLNDRVRYYVTPNFFWGNIIPYPIMGNIIPYPIVWGNASAMPSLEPSVAPSLAPSAMPSLQPNLAPSAMPSLEPSVAPSLAPSTMPSLQPSLAPSAMLKFVSHLSFCKTKSTRKITNEDI